MEVNDLKNRQITIEDYKNTSDVHTIIVNNARYKKGFSEIIEKVIRVFLVNEEVFFGFCRTDGMNLKVEQQNMLKNEIPAIINKNGEMEILSDFLTVARVKSYDDVRSFIPLIFDYYLETMLFNPKVDWSVFKQYHYNYQKHRIADIILSDFAEILFYYFDSGDFLVCFNSRLYNPKAVRSTLEVYFGL